MPEQNLFSTNITLSQNEIYDLCLKAARGAGFEWGIAEEIGRAVQWLSAKGVFEGMKFLPVILDLTAQKWHDFCPETPPQKWTSKAGKLNALALGICLNDFQSCAFKTMNGLDLFVEEEIIYPVFMLPFFAQIAINAQTNIGLESKDSFLGVTPTGNIIATPNAFRQKRTLSGRLYAPAIAPAPIIKTPQEACIFKRDIFEKLKEYADATLVPTSASSRADAGTNLSDND